jgi:predicted ATPase
LARVRESLEQAREGNGSLLVVEGPAGIGKSALLRSASELAEASGNGVLRGRGAELEQQYAFGVAAQLVDSMLATASGTRREQVFEGAAAFVRPLFDSDAGDEPPVRNPGFRTLHGLYWLIVNLARGSPLLLAVDDAHWSDEASLRFLAFLAGRLEGLPLLLLAAVRTGEPGAEAETLQGVLSDPAAAVLGRGRVGGRR